MLILLKGARPTSVSIILSASTSSSYQSYLHFPATDSIVVFYDIRLSSLLKACQDLLRIGCGAVCLIPSALMNIVLEVRLLPVPLCFYGSLLRKPRLTRCCLRT